MDAAPAILIVDDEPGAAFVVLKQALRRADFSVSEAVTLARLTELQPALVVLDVRTPEMSGFEVVENCAGVIGVGRAACWKAGWLWLTS